MSARIAWRSLSAATPLLLAALLLASVPAHAERVQAVFTYQDYGDNVARPINNAKVEIWRYAPRFLGIWDWAMDRRVWTDANGWIDVDMPWEGSGVVYRIRVYAANSHITVWPHDTAHVGESWYDELPDQTVSSSSAVLDFTHNFDWWGAARNFNIARAGWFAGEYMTQKYGTLATVNAQTTDIYSTFYDPVGDTLQIETAKAFNDFSVAHEYGHFVEEQIGSLPWRPTVHSLCTAYDPALAWMEGFAGYYSYAVARAFPGELQGGSSIEDGTLCSGTPRDSVEYVISATLWDLVDGNSAPYSSSEPHDWVSDNDWPILAIVDNELGAYGSQPTIWDFRNAWIARGWSQQDLDRILVKHGLLPDFNHAQFVSVTAPSSMHVGQSYAVRVSMRNSGTTTWTSATSYALGSQNTQDNARWGMYRVSLPGNVAPGQIANIDFTVTAPAQPGTYPFEWRMLREWVEWFGDTSAPHPIVVSGVQTAQFISRSVPSSMTAGNSYNVSVTMKNTGDTTWIPGSYFLGSQNPQDNNTWGQTRVALPYAVGPGGQVTFNFVVFAPSWGGPYNFQWKLLQNGIGWFGDASQNVSVSITTPPPSCVQSECVDSCIADGCRGGKCTTSGACQCLQCL